MKNLFISSLIIIGTACSTLKNTQPQDDPATESSWVFLVKYEGISKIDTIEVPYCGLDKKPYLFISKFRVGVLMDGCNHDVWATNVEYVQLLSVRGRKIEE